MVAAGHQVTAEAGAEVIRAGGNAIDGAIAAVCTAFTAEPALTGMGGGGFLLLREAGGRALLYDGFARMPKRQIGQLECPDFRAIPIDFGDTVQTFHIGQASVATPMLMAMLFQAHREHGRIPILEVLQPAIAAAKNGVLLNPLQASFLKLLTPILTDTPACRELCTQDEEILKEGEYFQNRNLANIFEILARDGIEEMYCGDIAKAIEGACSPSGLLTVEDLATQRVHVRPPLQLKVANGYLLTNPPPSSGGCLIAFSLHILEELHRRLPDLDAPTALAESLRAASHARGEGFDHRVRQPGMEEDFLSPERWRQSLNLVLQRIQHGGPGPGCELENRHGSTTHISAMDRDGLAVSVTTSNGEGSGIVVPETGIHLNNMLGEEDINPFSFHRLPAGETLSSMMAPSIFVRQGRAAMILGSGGSNRLRGAILQVFCRHVLAGEAIETAVNAPRIHNEGNILDCEPGALTNAERAFLQDIGWEIRDWSGQSVYFGGVHAITADAVGNLHGAGDPRRGGFVEWA